MEKARDELIKNNLKVTKTRLEILNYLYNTDSHPSANMILDYLKEKNISLSFATVYNCLEIFYKKGMILKMQDGDDIMRFDGKTNFHIHVIDKQTNEIKDIFDESIESMIEEKISSIVDKSKVRNMILSLHV